MISKYLFSSITRDDENGISIYTEEEEEKDRHCHQTIVYRSYCRVDMSVKAIDRLEAFSASSKCLY